MNCQFSEYTFRFFRVESDIVLIQLGLYTTASLDQGWATGGPRAACGPQSVRPAEILHLFLI
jgi:hypothetical protein